MPEVVSQAIRKSKQREDKATDCDGYQERLFQKWYLFLDQSLANYSLHPAVCFCKKKKKKIVLVSAGVAQW